MTEFLVQSVKMVEIGFYQAYYHTGTTSAELQYIGSVNIGQGSRRPSRYLN